MEKQQNAVDNVIRTRFIRLWAIGFNLITKVRTYGDLRFSICCRCFSARSNAAMTAGKALAYRLFISKFAPRFPKTKNNNVTFYEKTLNPTVAYRAIVGNGTEPYYQGSVHGRPNGACLQRQSVPLSVARHPAPPRTASGLVLHGGLSRLLVGEPNRLD